MPLERSAALVAFAREIAEAGHLLGQADFVIGEVFAFPAHQGIAVEVEGEVLDLGLSEAPSLGREVVPARLVEGIADRWAAEQNQNLATGHAFLQLFDVLGLDQVALMNRLAVDDAAAGHRHGDDEGEGYSAHPGSGSWKTCR